MKKTASFIQRLESVTVEVIDEIVDECGNSYPVFKITYDSQLDYDQAVERFVEDVNVRSLSQYPADKSVIVSWLDGFGFGEI